MPGFLDYGASKGLAVKHDWNRDTENLFQSEALKARDQQEKEQKTAFYAKQLQQGKAVAPANTQRLQDFYSDHNKKVADFVIKNPNFETDVTKMTEFMSLTDKYLNNDIIREDQQVQEEFTKLKGAINHGDLRPDEQFSEMQKYNEYKDGKTKDPYIFVPPQHADMEALVNKVMSNIPTDVETYIAKDGTEHTKKQVNLGKDVNGVALTWFDTAKNRMQDKEIAWQVQKTYDSSTALKGLFPGGATEYFADKLAKSASKSDVESGAGRSKMKSASPAFVNETWNKMDAIEANSKGAYVELPGSSNPFNAVFTEAGNEGGDFVIPQGGKEFNIISNQRDPDTDEPVINKVRINNKTQLAQAIGWVTVGGNRYIKSIYKVSIPLGGEDATEDGKPYFTDVKTGQQVLKENLYNTLDFQKLGSDAERDALWKQKVIKNDEDASKSIQNLIDSGFHKTNTAVEGGISMGASTIKGMQTFEGVGLSEAKIDQQSLYKFEKNYHSQDEMADITPNLSEGAMSAAHPSAKAQLINQYYGTAEQVAASTEHDLANRFPKVSKLPGRWMRDPNNPEILIKDSGNAITKYSTKLKTLIK